MVDVGEVEREFQTGMPPLEPLDMNMVKSAKTILFSAAKELANTKTANKYTRAKRERPLHNGQKGMLGTRIVHVLCPWWKSVFATMGL